MRTLAAWLLTVSAAGAVGAQPAPAPGYRFDEVRRKVVLTTGKQEVRVDKGQRAHSGDGVQTGFFSYALISSEQHRARFEIFASTDGSHAIRLSATGPFDDPEGLGRRLAEDLLEAGAAGLIGENP